MLSIADDGTHSVDLDGDGSMDVKGKHEIDGNQLTVWDTGGSNACPSNQKGVYSLTT